MGDRRNVIVKDSDTVGVSLYTHWGGSELPGVVKKALARKQRWDDGPYLTRIIFSEMIADEVKGETGYGISAADNVTEENKGHDIVIDVGKQTVKVGGAKAVSFEKFIEQ